MTIEDYKGAINLIFWRLGVAAGLVEEGANTFDATPEEILEAVEGQLAVVKAFFGTEQDK